LPRLLRRRWSFSFRFSNDDDDGGVAISEAEAAAGEEEGGDDDDKLNFIFVLFSPVTTFYRRISISSSRRLPTASEESRQVK
jgi:hypothetical protein